MTIEWLHLEMDNAWLPWIVQRIRAIIANKPYMYSFLIFGGGGGGGGGVHPSGSAHVNSKLHKHCPAESEGTMYPLFKTILILISCFFRKKLILADQDRHYFPCSTFDTSCMRERLCL